MKISRYGTLVLGLLWILNLNCAANDVQTELIFAKDPLAYYATLNISSGNEKTNAMINISKGFPPVYAIYPPAGYYADPDPDQVIKEALKKHPALSSEFALNADYVPLISQFFKEFNTREQIHKGYVWQHNRALREFGKQAFEQFDTEIDEIIEHHDKQNKL